MDILRPPSDKTTSANGVSEHSGPEAQPDVVEGIDEVETGEEQAEGDDSDDVCRFDSYINDSFDVPPRISKL
jgi:hypothetical protein